MKAATDDRWWRSDRHGQWSWVTLYDVSTAIAVVLTPTKAAAKRLGRRWAASLISVGDARLMGAAELPTGEQHDNRY